MNTTIKFNKQVFLYISVFQKTFRIHEILSYLKLCQGLLVLPRNVSICGKFDINSTHDSYFNATLLKI